tara:strand:+ start:18621 stop:18908 length:288 start_codon:yes stop_codon:yes gene_type:complete
MKDKLTIISDDLNHNVITEIEARSLLLNLLSVSNWVAVKEKPKCYVNVLVCFDKEWTSAERTGYWCGDSWIINGNKPILTDKVVFWRELPEPPCY